MWDTYSPVFNLKRQDAEIKLIYEYWIINLWNTTMLHLEKRHVFCDLYSLKKNSVTNAMVFLAIIDMSL